MSHFTTSSCKMQCPKFHFGFEALSVLAQKWPIPMAYYAPTTMGILWPPYGHTMGTPWGHTIGTLWAKHTSLGLLWAYNGHSMASLWAHHGHTMGIPYGHTKGILCFHHVWEAAHTYGLLCPNYYGHTMAILGLMFHGFDAESNLRWGKLDIGKLDIANTLRWKI
jgi:hypothetical protein